MLRARQFVAVAGLTAREATRQPICLLLATACVLLVGLTPLLILHNFGEDGKLVRDSGLAFHFIFGLLIAGYAACSTLGREVREGTAAAILSKPLSRFGFFLGKYFGVAVVVLVFSASAMIATLLSERVAEKFVDTNLLVGYITDWRTGVLMIATPLIAYVVAAVLNYRLQKPFGTWAFLLLLCALTALLCFSAFFDRLGRFAPFDFRVKWPILKAGLLVTMALLVLAAIAISISTRLGKLPTLTITGAAFLGGLMSDYLFGRTADVSFWHRLLYGILPNWQHFWMVDALNGGGTIPWGYLATAGGYALAYGAGVLLLGAASFQCVELK